MSMTEFWSGSVRHRRAPLRLLRQHNRLQPSNSPPLRSHLVLLPLLLLLPTRNDGNSRLCSVTWWTPPNFPPNSTPKSTGKSSVPINRLVRKLSHALMDISPNSLGMDSSSILAIPTPMKMTPKEQYGLVWEFLLPWET